MRKITLLLLALFLVNVLLAQNKLTLLVESVGNGHAKLTWVACQGGVSTSYQIERSFDEVNWETLAIRTSDQATVEYVDSLFACKSNVVYKVATLPTATCQASSDPVAAQIMDAENPEIVQIESLSVNHDSNKLVLNWKPCRSKDTWGYRIFVGSDATAFDTIYGAENTTYWVDGPIDTMRRFRITAFDSCYNNSLLSKPKRAFVIASEMLSCERKVRLSWLMPLESLDWGVGTIHVFAARDGEAFQCVGTGDGGTYFMDVPVSEDQQRYHFYMQAFPQDTTFSASSIIETRVVELAPVPDYVYVRSADFTDEHLLLTLHVDQNKLWSALKILKNEVEIMSIPFSNFVSSSTLQLPPEQASYRVVVADVCEAKSIETGLTIPVDLKASREGNRILLRWTPYEGWLSGVEKYRVWRLENGQETQVAERSALLGLNEYSWEEEYTDLSMLVHLSYRIEAVEAAGNPYGFKESAFSKREVLISENQVPIHVPTGFMPEGISSVFRPFFQSFPNDDYIFRIYNRYGEMLFESRDFNTGWDGKHNGEIQPAGVYLYAIQIDRQGQVTRKTGIFSLLR